MHEALQDKIIIEKYIEKVDEPYARTLHAQRSSSSLMKSYIDKSFAYCNYTI